MGLSSQPPRGPRPKKRRKHRGKSATEQLTLKIARRLEVVPRAKKTTNAFGRCLPHCFEELYFSSPWAALAFIEELARRNPRRKGNVRLPKWKRPDGVRAVIAVRHRECAGRGCDECEHYGWGVRYMIGIPIRPCLKHGAA